MIEDMRMHKLEPRTQEGHIRAVRKLTVFLKRSPDTATAWGLRSFQFHLVDTDTSPITLNATLAECRDVGLWPRSCVSWSDRPSGPSEYLYSPD